MMKQSKLVRLGILALTLAAGGLGAGTGAAHAGVITLDVSATMSPGGFPASCSPACILGGDIVINNTTGAVVSEDVTAAGFSPSVGPFTNNQGIGNAFPLTVINIDDSRRDTLQLVVATPTAGSLVGYTGGPLDPTTVLLVIPGFWNLTSGSLAQPTAAPEPSSLLLLLASLAGLCGLLAVSWRTKRTTSWQI